MERTRVMDRVRVWNELGFEGTSRVNEVTQVNGLNRVNENTRVEELVRV